MSADLVTYQELKDENNRLKEEIQKLNRELADCNLQRDNLVMEELKRINREQKEFIHQQECVIVKQERLVALGTLVAGIAHEINNPTTYIRGNLELLEKYWKRMKDQLLFSDDFVRRAVMDEVPKLLQATHGGTTRISEIVKSLKVFSNQGSLDVSDINVVECIEDSIKLVSNELKERAIEIVKDFEVENLNVCASKSSLEQVFVNLFLNSVYAFDKCKEKGSKMIGIKLKKDGKDYFQITVKDNAIGISKDIIGEIFNPFFTTHVNDGGTGLGLSIVSGIIEEYRGKIAVQSKEGEWTEFIIRLPIAHGECG